MSVGIVLVTFNCEKYISRCLDSLLRQTCKDTEIIVWENGSSDGTINLVREYRQVELIDTGVNVGFAEGCNRGAKRMLRRGHDHILFINPDTMSDEHMLQNLLDGMASSGAGIVQPNILLFDQKTLNTDGNNMHYLGLSFCENYEEPYGRTEDRPIFSASGACMLVKKDVFESVGYFDPDFFMYQEDTDFSWRAHLNGYKIYSIGSALIYHDYQLNLQGKKYFFLEKNRINMLIKNYSFKSMLLILPALVFLEIQLLVYSLFKGWFQWKLLSYFHIFITLPATLKKRQYIQKKRAVSDAKTMALFKSSLDFKEINNSVIQSFTNPVLGVYYEWVRRLI